MLNHRFLLVLPPRTNYLTKATSVFFLLVNFTAINSTYLSFGYNAQILPTIFNVNYLFLG